MPNHDVFTGGPSGSPIDWSTGTWSGDNPPTASDTVVEQGAGVDNLGVTLGGLILHNGASLTVDGSLTVTGATDTAFGGHGSALTIASGVTVVESSVTSAAGTVNVEAHAQYAYDGSGGSQTIDASGGVSIEGSHDSDSITLNSLTLSGDSGSDNGGVVHLHGGLWEEAGTNDSTTIDMSGGGIFLDGSASFSGVIEGFGLNGTLAVADYADVSGHLQSVGTPSGYSIDAAAHTITFDFTTSSGAESQTLTFDTTTDVANMLVSEYSNGFTVNPIDEFTGAAGGGHNLWSAISDWSAGALPTVYAAVEQTGDGVMNLSTAGDPLHISSLGLANGAHLAIPDGRSLVIDGEASAQSLSGAGSTIDVAGTLTVDVSYSETTDDFSVGSGDIAVRPDGVLNLDANFSGTITQLGAGGVINVSSLDQSASGFTINANNTVTLNFTNGVTYTLAFNSTHNLSVEFGGSSFQITSTPVCFAADSRIATTRGEIPVEDLAVGDLVITASGQTRPIVWLGHRRIAAPSPDAWPVRVTAGAFGEGLPARDLRLSPGHAVCVDVMGDVLVPVHRLANGVTIFPEPATEVTYWHVELASHDVILAEGLACESYMEAGNRGFFGRQYGLLQTLDPDRVAESLTRYARPFVDGGAIVEAIRERLAARAANLTRRRAA